MESYGKVAITITTTQLVSVGAAVQANVCKAVCGAFEHRGLDYVFFGALDEALGRVGIVLEFEDVGIEKGAEHAIVLSNRESHALAALQAETWRKGIAAGCSVPAVVDDLVNATLAHLGIKVKAPQKPAKERLRRVA